MTTRILQISDLHIGDENREEENLDTIIEYIINKDEWNTNKPIVIVVTGDITHRGKRKEFISARNAFAHLKHQTDHEILFLPGNHDYGAHGVFGEVSEDRFNNFKQIFGKVFDNFSTIKYPNEKVINGHTIINLDSIQGQLGTKDDKLADGEVGRNQRNELNRILSKPEIKDRSSEKKVILCLHHHPFIFPGESLLVGLGEKVGHALDDDDELREVIKGRVDVLIFGHDHKHLNFSDTYLSGEVGDDAYNIPKILSCGKSTENGKEYILSEDGTVDSKKSRKNPDRKLGFFGWYIEIEDNGDVKVEIEVFN